jgi:hypothetical protein
MSPHRYGSSRRRTRSIRALVRLQPGISRFIDQGEHVQSRGQEKGISAVFAVFRFSFCLHRALEVLACGRDLR